ncbi:DUF3180 domain-containing protein [Kocuria sp.]|uniref:DUF3180 domain-containing protein n=1 Tax=Kocuria sp. TaxID=1871328 RepID=UPI0026DCCC20|nr:DUF3180 domain-containing protein [Kocuria sp.]MDO4919208.1 DUF3180 domain-containing protein [Kocuria sp.]
MRYLNLLSLVAVAAVAAAVGWSLDHAVGGGVQSMLILPWVSLLAELGAAVVVGYLGLRVRAYRDPGKGAGRRRDPARRKPYDPVWAVGTAAAAQAVAYYGALCAGWHTGLGVEQAALLGVRSTQEPLWLCVVHVVSGILLAVLGWIVERWCRLPPDDPDAQGGTPLDGRSGPYAGGEGGYARER